MDEETMSELDPLQLSHYQKNFFFKLKKVMIALYQSSSTILLQLKFKRVYVREITLVNLSDRLQI